MDWLDLLAVQGTLKSLLQHHSSKASILQCSAFFTVQLSHPYMTTGKTIAMPITDFLSETSFLCPKYGRVHKAGLYSSSVNLTGHGTCSESLRFGSERRKSHFGIKIKPYA